MKSGASQPNKSSSSRGAKLRVVSLLLAVVGLVVAGYFLDWREPLRRVLDWLGALGPWAPILFLAACVFGSVALVPVWMLLVGAGILFGFWLGLLYAWLGAMLGGCSSFLIGRYLARDWIARKLQRYQKLQAVDVAVAEGGWRTAALLMLMPIVPFNLLSYALSLSRLSLRSYLTAACVSLLPGVVLYVVSGWLIGDLALLEQKGRELTGLEWALHGAGLAAAGLVALLVTRQVKRALQKRGVVPGRASQ